VEIYTRLRRPVSGERYRCLFYRRSPWAVVLFLTNFLMLHLAFIGTILAWLLGGSLPGLMGLGAIVMLTLSYAWPDLKRWGLRLGAAFAGLRYLADLALFLGAFLGGLHQKMLYFSAPVD